jgi:hypothetical protein
MVTSQPAGGVVTPDPPGPHRRRNHGADNAQPSPERVSHAHANRSRRLGPQPRTPDPLSAAPGGRCPARRLSSRRPRRGPV